MHKFLLAENPQAPETGGLWIIHLPDPIFIIEAVIDGEKINSKKAIYKKDFIYVNSYGVVEHWQLRIYHYFTTDFDENKVAEKICNKMLEDAWYWYEAYLIWEDNNIDDL